MDIRLAQIRTQPLLQIIRDFWRTDGARLESSLLIAAEEADSPRRILNVFADAFARKMPLIPLLVFWRYTQTVAAFDETMGAALDRTDVSQTIERPIFERLAGQPVFFPFEPMPMYPAADGEAAQPLCGALVGVMPMPDAPKDAHDLNVWALFISADGMGFKPFHFSLTSRSDGLPISALLDELPAAWGPALRDMLTHLLQRVIFACCDMPEAAEWRRTSFVQPTGKRIRHNGGKRIMKLFPPDKPRIAILGEETGRTIRAMESAAVAAGTGRTVRPHIRRAHWHTYYYGPRSAEHRESRLHWNLPTFVNLAKSE